MNLNEYKSGHIESFLLNYELLVKDLAEVAADWPDMDGEERGQCRATLMQTWGNRKVMGVLYQAQRLTPAQVKRLTELDRLLLEGAPLMAQSYGLDLPQLLAIFRWGTPLTQATRPIRVELYPASLNHLAMSLAPVATRYSL